MEVRLFIKKLVQRVPPIARRDAELRRIKRKNAALKKDVERLGDVAEGRAHRDDLDYGTLAEQAELLRASDLFDGDWYREQHPGVLEPITDYLARGHEEGASPHPCFDADWYRDQCNLRSFAGPALVHFLRVGAEALVSPHPMFLPDRYVKAHPESAQHAGGPLGHFLAGNEAPPAAVRKFDGVTASGEFLDAARSTGRSLRAARGFEHLARESTEFDFEAERDFKAKLRAHALDAEPLVSVILPSKDRADVLPAALESVLGQTYTRWELIVVDDASRDATPDVLRGYLEDPRIRVVRHEVNRGVAAARNAGLKEATGAYVAFLDSDNTWEPDFLELMVRFVSLGGHRVAYAMSALQEQHGGSRTRFRGMSYSRDALRERNYIDCIVILHERALLDEVGGFDESLRRNVDWEYLIRLADVADFAFAPFIATRYDLWETGTGRITTDEVASYRYLVRQRVLVDWDAARGDEQQASLASVVLVANSTARTVATTIDRLLSNAEREVEIIVVDSKLDAAEATQLQFRFWSDPRVRVLRLSQELPMEVGRNVGAVASRGEVLVFLPEAVWAERGWDAPLVDELAKFSLVQPLVLNRQGTVKSAGVARARGGSAVSLFERFAGDAPELRVTREAPAVAPLAVAVKAAEFLALEGFDPLYVQDHLGPDLAIRLAKASGRACAVAGKSVIALTEDELPRTRATKWVSAIDNANRLAQRWPAAEPPNAPGYAVAGFQRDAGEQLRPLLVHNRSERPLRWAIKIGAPDVPRRARWGDWHFATALRDSLERLGHEVTIDCREAWYRETAHLDDVTLVLRGRGPYRVNPSHTNLVWVISHPDEVTAAELRGYDAVFGASPRWCDRVNHDLEQPAVPLLQCTDHRRFAPGPTDPERVHEVLMVANARGRRPAVDAALEGGVVPAVYGYRWNGLLPSGAWKGENVPNEELAAVYRAAGVVLNDHWEDMRRDGLLSNRLFDLAACEARMVSDYLPEIREVFGDAVPTFHEPAELPQLIRDVTFDSRERQQARRELGERVRREHTFDARARQISERVAQLRSKQFS